MYFLRFLQIPVIPRFLTRFIEILKAIDMIPNRVRPLGVNTKQENLMVYGVNFTQCICTGYCNSWILSLLSFIINSWLYQWNLWEETCKMKLKKSAVISDWERHRYWGTYIHIIIHTIIHSTNSNYNAKNNVYCTKLHTMHTMLN